MTDPDPTAVDDQRLDHRADDDLRSTGSWNSPSTGAGLTASGFATATGEGYARVMTSELDIDEATEALVLRSSLPFDPRDLPTPTAVPPVTLRPAAPTQVAPAPAPLAAWRRLSWVALPTGMLLSAVVTWAALRSASPPVLLHTTAALTSTATASAPAGTPTTAGVATDPAASATVATVAGDVPGSAASVSAAASAPAPTSASPRFAGKPANRPFGKGLTKATGKSKPPAMPGSGL